MHRIGGLEKDLRTGNISYDAANHQAMTNLRADKVAAVAKFIPPQMSSTGRSRAGSPSSAGARRIGAIYQAVRAIPDRER